MGPVGKTIQSAYIWQVGLWAHLDRVSDEQCRDVGVVVHTEKHFTMAEPLVLGGCGRQLALLIQPSHVHHDFVYSLADKYLWH